MQQYLITRPPAAAAPATTPATFKIGPKISSPRDPRDAARDQLCSQHHGWRNYLVAAADLPRSNGNVVTDALHFDGSLYQYGEFAGRASMCVSFGLATDESTFGDLDR